MYEKRWRKEEKEGRKGGGRGREEVGENTKEEAAVLPNVCVLHECVCVQLLGSTGSNYTLNFNKNSFILLLKFPLLFEKLKGHLPRKYCLVFINISKNVRQQQFIGIYNKIRNSFCYLLHAI